MKRCRNWHELSWLSPARAAAAEGKGVGFSCWLLHSQMGHHRAIALDRGWLKGEARHC
ncbi:MAG: hypothetical protein QNL17_03875 [Synechococcus sp. ChSW.bin.154]